MTTDPTRFRRQGQDGYRRPARDRQPHRRGGSVSRRARARRRFRGECGAVRLVLVRAGGGRSVRGVEDAASGCDRSSQDARRAGDHRLGCRASPAGGRRAQRLQGSALPDVQRAAGRPHEAFLSVPVLSRGKLVGVINLQHRQPHEHSRQDIQLISTIGFLVGAEIEMARLEVENTQLSERLETQRRAREGHPPARPRRHRRRGLPHHPAAEPPAAEVEEGDCGSDRPRRRPPPGETGLRPKAQGLRRPKGCWLELGRVAFVIICDERR